MDISDDNDRNEGMYGVSELNFTKKNLTINQ
jgi:hypothetical protein